MVPEGFVLVEIDSKPFDEQLKAAQGQLERDQELLKEANVNLDRYREAYKQNAIPKQQLDDQASLVRQLEGAVKLDEGQVASAQTQVDYCRIKSPVAGLGLVGLRRVDAGNIVHAADTGGLVVITQLDPITVIFSVAEDYLPAIQEQLRRGLSLSVEVLNRARQKTIATGTLLAVDSQIDTTTGTIRLKAKFDNKDGALFPNQFVNARLLLNTLSEVTLVPADAIQRSAQGAFVYVVKPDHTLEMRPVEVGITEGDVASVTGLKPDETIAADNFNRLQEGTVVAERKASSGSSAPAEAAELRRAGAVPGTPQAPKSPTGGKP
jgi:multidrug efflux system membrane fusion protein